MDNPIAADLSRKFVRPGLEGLMHGSVSTLVPAFSTTFATFNSGMAFAVGLAAMVVRRHQHGICLGGVR